MTYPLKTLDTGITFRVVLPGLVPELEEREAARVNGYTWEAWTGLERLQRVSGLAYARVKRAIEMHQHDAQEREHKRQQSRANKGRR